MAMTHKTHVILRKILMMKNKDRKCYMHLKFHINPPYIVYVINCILTHTFFFPWVYYFVGVSKISKWVIIGCAAYIYNKCLYLCIDAVTRIISDKYNSDCGWNLHQYTKRHLFSKYKHVWRKKKAAKYLMVRCLSA